MKMPQSKVISFFRKWSDIKIREKPLVISGQFLRVNCHNE
jgi:hypothetical protein